ncbi:MAG TPA: hypothetical protein VKM93_19865 [Terriglobia bacterium]|nr:hypothetical protein [Terriglobia bacterium]
MPGQTFPGTGTVTLVASGAGLTGGPVTSAGTLSIANNGVTDAMLAAAYSGTGSCASGKFVTTMGRAAAPTCAAGNTGTVTSVGTGAGLTGGPIVTTGSLSIATSGVTDAMLANAYSGTGSCAAGRFVTTLSRAAAPTCATTGSVTSVGSGAGLTGGPITSSGTLSIAPGAVTDAMLAGSYSGTGSCAAGSVVSKLTRNAAPTCTATGLGTVTSVGSGAGLTGGPITGSGALSIAPGGVTNTMLQQPSLTVNTGAGLSGGGPVALGSSLSLSNTGVLAVGTTAGSGILVGGTAANPLLSADPSLLATTSSVSSAVSGGVATAENFASNAVNTASSAITGSTLTVTPNSPLTGGGTFQPGTSASLTLGVDTNALDSTLNTTYAQLGAPNTFTLRQTLGGGGLLPATGAATSGVPASSNGLDLLASSWNGSQAVTEQFRWQAEGNGASDTGSLNLLAATGTQSLAETGLAIGSNGLITFAPGQVFPGTTSGTVTRVATGAGLTGGPVTSSGTVSIATGGVTNSMLANPTLMVTAGTALTGGGAVSLGGNVTLNVDTTKVPQLSTSNTFTGAITASSVSTSGSGAGKVQLSSGATNVSWTLGAGAPSGACAVGSLYSRTDGGPGSTLYVCEGPSGTWAGK